MQHISRFTHEERLVLGFGFELHLRRTRLFKGAKRSVVGICYQIVSKTSAVSSINLGVDTHHCKLTHVGYRSWLRPQVVPKECFVKQALVGAKNMNDLEIEFQEFYKQHPLFSDKKN